MIAHHHHLDFTALYMVKACCIFYTTVISVLGINWFGVEIKVSMAWTNGALMAVDVTMCFVFAVISQ